MIHFESPHWLWLLLALPLLVFRHVREERGEKGSLRFADLGVLRQLRPTLWTRLRHSLIVLKVASLGCLMVAMARPQSGLESREISAEGIDIMLTLDVSRSMEHKDLAQGEKSRLQVAKEVVADFAGGRQADRLGVVVFAGQSFTQCPLTLDYSMLLDFLDGVEIPAKRTRHADWHDSTAIGMALINACNRLRHSEAESKVIILLTDGENNAGEIEPLTAAEVAAAVGIRVYTIGVGASEQVQRGLFPRLYQRAPRIDEETLMEVAGRTGGKYYRATSEEKLQEIYREIGELEKTEIKTEIKVDYADRFPAFLWSGMALLLLGTALANTRFRSIP